MRLAIDQWIQHYATVTNGESALFRENLLELSSIHHVAEAIICDAFAVAVVEAFVGGKLDADRAAFAIDDLFWAADCSLSGFALEAFDALEYGESTVSDVQELLSRRPPESAA